MKYQDGTEIKEGHVCAYTEMDGTGKYSYADAVGVIIDGMFVSHCNRDGGDESKFSMRTCKSPVELHFHNQDEDGNIIDLVKLDMDIDEISTTFCDDYFGALLKALSEDSSNDQ